MKPLRNNLHETFFGKFLIPFYESQIKGRNTFAYRDEAESNQWLSRTEIETLQWSRLQSLLRHAYDTVPYYRETFDKHGLQPENINSEEDFARLPILEKSTIRANKDQLISSKFSRDSLIRSATGGSTGESLQFGYDRNSYERRIATAMRGDRWAGWRLCAPEFYIWGAAIVPESKLTAKKKSIHHALVNRKIVNSFNMSPDDIPNIVKKYNQQRPSVVIGYANALYEFACFVENHKEALHRPEGVVSSAEVLYDYQRKKIELVFGCKVFNRYGCREVMMIAAECEQHTGLHIASDNVYVEIVKDGIPCKPGETGEILLTDLHNYGMPFIRYKVGDLGSFKEEMCSCGRGLPSMNVVSGRILDVIRTPSGKIISGEFFPHLLKDFPEIGQYEILQTQLTTINVKFKMNREFSNGRENLVTGAISRAVGDEIAINWEIGENVNIDRTRKFRPVRSLVSHSVDNE